MLGWSIEVHTLAQQPSPSYLGRDGTALWLLNFTVGSGTLWQLKELSCGAHHSPGFAVQLTDKVLQNSSNLHKNAIQDFSSYVNPRVTWRHHVHHYCLREARYLINHTFSDIHWSFHFFFFPDDLFSKASPWSVYLHLGMATWSLGLRPQSHFTSQSVVLDRTLMVLSLSAQSCASSLQLKSMSGQGSMTSPVLTNTMSSLSLASFLMALTAWQWHCHCRLWQKCWTRILMMPLTATLHAHPTLSSSNSKVAKPVCSPDASQSTMPLCPRIPILSECGWDRRGWRWRGWEG